MDMRKHDPTYDGQSSWLDETLDSFPWNREALALKIQAIDGCSRRAARRQVNDMAVCFTLLAGSPFSSRPRHLEATPVAPVYVRYRRDCTKLSGWLLRTSQLPLVEPHRT